MTRLMAAVVAGLVVIGAGGAQTAPAAKSIDGEYKVLSATRGGKAEDQKKLDEAEFVFRDGKITVIDGVRKDESAEFKLDPTKTPAHIDIFPGRGTDKKVLGIYQTKATKDGVELLLAFTKDGDRPTDFKGEGEGTMVLKLFRKTEK